MRKFNLDGYSDGTRIRGKRDRFVFITSYANVEPGNEGDCHCSSISPIFRVTNRVVRDEEGENENS